jgi:mRNA-degrading endonuclease HigB of HigAB toxin-antitoxin module
MESKLKSLVAELMKEIEQEEMELDEMSVTANVAGYNTPNAFKKTDGTDEDETTDDSFVDKINTSTGYTRVTENRFHQLRKEDSTPNQKIGVGLRNVRKQLSEIEKFVEWYSRIKTENGLEKSGYWKRTNRNLNAIKERLNKITEKIHSL